MLHLFDYEKDKKIKIQDEIVGDYVDLNGSYCNVIALKYFDYNNYSEEKNGTKVVTRNYIDTLCLELYNCISGLLRLKNFYTDSVNSMPKSWSSIKKNEYKKSLDDFQRSTDFFSYYSVLQYR